MITKKDFMLCESITETDLPRFKDSERYKANLKFDGERIIGIKMNGEVYVVNRVGRIKNHIYPEIETQLKEIEGDFILDGECITLDGLFNSLQHRSNLGDKAKIENAVKNNPIKFMVFDLLYYGKDLRQKPLKERITILKENFSKLNLVEYGDINDLLSFAKSNKKEGIVVKDMLSYYEGRRSKSWLKLKLFKEAEFRAVRYTTNNAGIRLEDIKLNAVQCSGTQSDEVRKAIDEKGYCDIVIQYLEKTKDDKYRFISFKEVMK